MTLLRRDCVMDYGLLGSVMSLVLTDDFYSKQPVFAQRNAIYYAVKHGKCLVHTVDNDVVGFATYGFFTDEELRKDSWDGDQAYARGVGGVLFFPKFQCRAGRREVIKFIRNIQSFMFENYPNVEIGGGLRVYPDGSTRSEKWHRKVA